MSEIRKISIGTDLKDGAMHYIVGQKVLGDTQEIHCIEHDKDADSFKIFIINELSEIRLWKEFRHAVPISIEFNINF
jgi:hypothetical protein